MGSGDPNGIVICGGAVTTQEGKRVFTDTEVDKSYALGNDDFVKDFLQATTLAAVACRKS